MEQGYVKIVPGEHPNDAIRRVNEEGWDVIQVTVHTRGPQTYYGLLVQRRVEGG